MRSKDTAENARQVKPKESEQIPTAQPSKPKKRHIWRWVAGTVAVLILIPVLYLGYLGFVPGLSSVFGSNKPKDLGVRYTAADYTSYQQKTGSQYLDFANAPPNPNKPGKKIVFGDPKQMDLNLTQSEVTAAINSVGWAWMPIKNAQVRFGDGTVEVSGNVNGAVIPDFVNFIGGVGYSQSDVEKASVWAKRLGNPPIYLKGNATVTDNVLDLRVTEAQVGRFKVSIASAEKVLSTGTINIKNNAVGYFVQSASFQNSQLHFVGTAPTTTYVKH